ncbi:hypothetical protein R7Z48_10280 [Vibrio sp. 1567]|uniref:serine O-acetyltransferase n=1 Tax=Vibrio sp. 1567 TaxID=3074564 RepID=UPI0029651828|nr:hypothetical protein [Vibrio sp. 1567]MDW2169816.1 hypothetical protein [Vibrio sp. 1567]
MLIKFFKKIVLFIVSGAGFRVNTYIDIIVYLKFKKRMKLAGYICNHLQNSHGVFISPRSKFDSSLCLRHPVGIVIGDGVTIGKNVIIYQNVTLGGARVGDAELNNYPTVGEGTVVFSGAIVIGKIHIGKNCVIGANSVVLSDIPENCIVAGSPAKIIGTNNNE